MAAPGTSFVNCTALGKNLDVRPLVTLIEEAPWEVDPGGMPREAVSSFESELLANDKSYSEIFFSSCSPLIKLSRKIIFAEPVGAL